MTAFLVLPAMAAGVVPWLLLWADPWRRNGTMAGLAVLVVGGVVLLWCVRDFYVVGQGTLAPWSPPRRLVVVGLYRWCRNPMYLGVLTVALGWAVSGGSLLVGVYAACLALAFHLRVVLYEEPTLASLFGTDWDRYRAAVPRWLPRWPASPRS